MKTNNTHVTAQQHPSVKKVWQAPEVWVLDRNEDVNGGASHTFHESLKSDGGGGSSAAPSYHS